MLQVLCKESSRKIIAQGTHCLCALHAVHGVALVAVAYACHTPKPGLVEVRARAIHALCALHCGCIVRANQHQEGPHAHTGFTRILHKAFPRLP